MRTNFKWDQPTRVEEALRKATEDQRNEATVYREVNARDGFRCRVCHSRTDPYELSVLRGDHHHIVYRSAGGATTTANVCLLCARCHNDEHRHRLRVDGNADEGLTFFRKDEHGAWYVVRREIVVRVVEQD